MMNKIKTFVATLDITKLSLNELLILAEIINEVEKYETNKCLKEAMLESENEIINYGFQKNAVYPTLEKEDYCD